MADILLDTQVAPATPAAGKAILFFESGGKRATYKDDSGRTSTVPGIITNYNTTDSAANATNTYIAGSALTVPTGLTLQVGTTVRWRFGLTKNAAGTTAAVWTVKVGTAGTTADATVLTFTSGSVQTAATDTAWIDIYAVLRNVGASGVMAGIFHMIHQNAATGFASVQNQVLQATSAGFVTTTAGLIVGVAVDPGAANFTHQVVLSEMVNI